MIQATLMILGLALGGSVPALTPDDLVRPGKPQAVNVANQAVFGMQWRQSVVRTGIFRTVGESFGVPAVLPGQRRVVVATGEGEVRSYHLDTGVLQWRVRFEGDFETTVNPFRGADGTWSGLVVDRTGKARLLKLSDGSVQWTSKLGADCREHVTLEGETLYVTTVGNEMLALEYQSGRVLWRQGRPKSRALTVLGHGAPVIAGDLVLGTFSDGYVVAYDSQSGAVRWQRQLSVSEADFVDANATPVYSDGVVFVSSYSDGIYALEALSGDLLWERAAPSVIGLAFGQGELFAGSADGYVWGLDPRSGEPRFRTRLQEGPVIGLHYDKGALIFAGGKSGLVVLSATNGAPLQATSLGARAINPPRVSGKHLVLLSAAGYLYSFELGQPHRNLH
ncbi:MAG: PQQ-binding-like beta-propeller repeat protein [Myxococcota bacterium]|nr:PQQ-binding-like beta-propeller repeat protein [Myxococcota bacterium]